MKLGFICLNGSGHLNPMTALARKLQARNHEVIFLYSSDAAGLPVFFEKNSAEPNITRKAIAEVSKMQGEDALEFGVKTIRQTDKDATHQLLADIEELASQIQSRSAEMEASGRIPIDLLESLKAIDVFRMFVPRSHGGLELDFTDGIEIIQALARIDGSVGWIAGFSNGGSLLATFSFTDCFALGGSQAVYEGSALQHRLRDLLVGSQHFAAQKRQYVTSGKLLLETTSDTPDDFSAVPASGAFHSSARVLPKTLPPFSA
jgi:hypothetical protein